MPLVEPQGAQRRRCWRGYAAVKQRFGDRARQQVDQDLAKGQEVGVRGTPSFYIDERPYDGDLSPEALGVWPGRLP